MTYHIRIHMVSLVDKIFGIPMNMQFYYLENFNAQSHTRYGWGYVVWSLTHRDTP